jgi:hypothetical protein
MSSAADASAAIPSGELPIIEASLDLIRWFVPLLQRLPRQHKFGLGDRLIANLYHLLEQLVHARYARAKLPILQPPSRWKGFHREHRRGPDPLP